MLVSLCLFFVSSLLPFPSLPFPPAPSLARLVGACVLACVLACLRACVLACLRACMLAFVLCFAPWSRLGSNDCAAPNLAPTDEQGSPPTQISNFPVAFVFRRRPGRSRRTRCRWTAPTIPAGSSSARWVGSSQRLPPCMCVGQGTKAHASPHPSFSKLSFWLHPPTEEEGAVNVCRSRRGCV